MSNDLDKTATATPDADEGTKTPDQPTDANETPKADDPGKGANQDANKQDKAEPKTEGKTERIVPEKYDLKLPDGAVVDAATLEKVSAYAKENKLTNEEAQAILNRDNANIASFVEAQKEQLANTSKEWLETMKVDQEIGGETFVKNVELAKRVIDRFGTDDFKKALNETGFGNYPELVRVLVRIGKAMTDDQLVLAGSQAGGKKSAVDVLYGKPTENKGE